MNSYNCRHRYTSPGARGYKMIWAVSLYLTLVDSCLFEVRRLGL